MTVYSGAKVGMDMYKNGITPENTYNAVSTVVGACGIVGAFASFTVEMYRQGGVFFIEKVNEANSFFDKNPLYFYQSAGF